MENDWSENRKLLREWHEQDMRRHDGIDKKLDELSLQIAEVRFQARVSRWITGLIMPGGIALIFSALAKKLGF